MLSLSDYNQTDIIEAFNSISRYLDELLNIDTRVSQKITEPYLVTSKMDIYLDDISLKLYVIYLIT